MKKIAVLIYPDFSMQEISCLTDALVVYYDQHIDVFASSKDLIKSEDCFQVVANKTLDEFQVEEYACVILPGIYNPLPALFDDKIIAFLSSLKDKDILIASISSSPMLLAKAGLLKHVSFTSGMWQEVVEYLPFVEVANLAHQPLVKDKNIITATGFAFREFAIEVIRTLQLDACENGLFNQVNRSYTKEELTFYMGKDNFQEFKDEYQDFLNKRL